MSCDKGVHLGAAAAEAAGLSKEQARALWAKGKVKTVDPLTRAPIEVDAAIYWQPCRLDFSRTQDGRVVVSKYEHRPDGRDHCFDRETKEAGFDLEATVARWEKSGYTVQTDKAGTRRAFRIRPWPLKPAVAKAYNPAYGVTTDIDAATAARPPRIDFVFQQGKVRVSKWDHVDAGHDVCFSQETKPPDFDLDAAIAWCEKNGYTVRRWDAQQDGGQGEGGVRAFLGDPWPIATGRTIKRQRTRMHFRGEDPYHKMDLAYDGA